MQKTKPPKNHFCGLPFYAQNLTPILYFKNMTGIIVTICSLKSRSIGLLRRDIKVVFAGDILGFYAQNLTPILYFKNMTGIIVTICSLKSRSIGLLRRDIKVVFAGDILGCFAIYTEC